MHLVTLKHFKWFKFKNRPYLFTFSFSFPTGKLKQQRTFNAQFISIWTLTPPTLFLLSHSVFRRMSHISRGLTYTYLFSVLTWEKPSPFSDIKFAHCLFSVHGCQPSMSWSAHTTYSCCSQPPSTVAVCRCNHYQRCHCHHPIMAIVRIGDLLLLPPLCSSWDIQIKVPFTNARP